MREGYGGLKTYTNKARARKAPHSVHTMQYHTDCGHGRPTRAIPIIHIDNADGKP